MLLNTLLTTLLSSSKILHQCVTSRGSITLGCADILSANQHDIVMFMRRWCDYLPCSSCDEANGWNFGSWTLTVVIWSVTLYSIVKIIPRTVPSYRQHVVHCRCIQNSIQSNCCSAKLSTSFLLSYDPVTVQLLLCVDYIHCKILNTGIDLYK